MCFLAGGFVRAAFQLSEKFVHQRVVRHDGAEGSVRRPHRQPHRLVFRSDIRRVGDSGVGRLERADVLPLLDERGRAVQRAEAGIAQQEHARADLRRTKAFVRAALVLRIVVFVNIGFEGYAVGLQLLCGEPKRVGQLGVRPRSQQVELLIRLRVADDDPPRDAENQQPQHGGRDADIIAHCVVHAALDQHNQYACGQQHAAHDIKNDRRFLREILGKAFTVHGHYLRFFHRLRRRGLFRARSLYI